MRRILWPLVCVLTVTSISPAAFPDNAKLSGAVTDKMGVSLPGVSVIVHWDRSGSNVGLESNVGLKEDVTLHADKMGTYSVDLPPGFYDVFVSSPGFEPSCRKVRLWPGKSATFSAKLTVSLLVTKELADKPF